eukprot:scaffold800_cov159-Pinguiococcus_pyrenoidosus.AAC.2
MIALIAYRIVRKAWVELPMISVVCRTARLVVSLWRAPSSLGQVTLLAKHDSRMRKRLRNARNISKQARVRAVRNTRPATSIVSSPSSLESW